MAGTPNAAVQQQYIQLFYFTVISTEELQQSSTTTENLNQCVADHRPNAFVPCTQRKKIVSKPNSGKLYCRTIETWSRTGQIRREPTRADASQLEDGL